MRYNPSFLGVIKMGEIYSPGSVTLGTITPLAFYFRINGQPFFATEQFFLWAFNLKGG